MTYYDTAEGVTITRARAMQELDKHGALPQAYEFFEELGFCETYAATDVLNFLGY